MAIGTLHYSEATVYKAQKALVAAKFTGLDLDKKVFDAAKDGRKPDFLLKNPTGKVPYLETEAGCIAASNGCAKYIVRCRADSTLYGACFEDEGAVDTWLDFCVHEIEAPLAVWVYPVMGLMAEAPSPVLLQAQGDVKKALTEVENRLQSSSFLIGDEVSLADIVVICALRMGLELVFDASFRKPYPKIVAWFQKCCAMRQFKEVLGDVKLCDKVQAAKPFAPPARGGDKTEAKKGDAKKDEKKGRKSPKQSPKQSPAAAPPAAASAAAATTGQGDATAIGEELRLLKEKLKGEGVTGKKLSDNPDVKALVVRLTAAKAGGGSAVAAAPVAVAKASPKLSPKASPKAAPKASPKAAPKKSSEGGNDIESQVKAVGDDLRVLKEKLKAEGITGKKLNAHAEVSALVAKLSELKGKM